MAIRMHFIILRAAAAAAALLPIISHAAGRDEIVSRLQRRSGSISTISADFTQEVFSKNSVKPQVSQGKVYFKKPGKMKWIYTGASSDVLVSDGKTVWFFQPDLNQAVERRLDKASSNITTDFLTGVGDIKKDFFVRLAGEKEKTYTLELIPKETIAGLRAIYIEFDKAQYMILRTEAHDFFGNRTVISFRDISVDKPISDSFFEWSPPKGVGVIRQ